MALLTPQQFAQTDPGRAGKSYASYKSYVNKNAPVRRAQRAQRAGVDVGTMNELDFLHSILGGASPAYKTMSDKDLTAQASTDVHAIVDPAIQQIRDSFGAKTKTGLDSIYGYGKATAAELEPLADRVKGYYKQDEADMQGADQALRAFLGGQGAAASADVAGKLSAAGLPQEAVDAASQGAGALQAGAAGSLASNNFSELEHNIGDRAADVNYAAKLPALANLQTADTARGFRTAQQQAENDQVGQVTSSIPGLSRQVLSDYRDRDLAKAQAGDSAKGAWAQLAASLIGGSKDRASQERIAKAGLALDTTKLQQDDTHFYDSLTADQTKTETAAGTDAKANRQKAIAAREDAKATTLTAVAQLASSLAGQQTVKQEEPVLAKFPTKAGKYVKKGGGRTNDPAQAETRPVDHVKPGLGYQELFQRAYSLYAPQLRRYALKESEIKQIIDQGLAGAGITAPAPPKPVNAGSVR